MTVGVLIVSAVRCGAARRADNVDDQSTTARHDEVIEDSREHCRSEEGAGVRAAPGGTCYTGGKRAKIVFKNSREIQIV